MKLLIAGSDEIWAMEKHYYRYLVEAGIDVQVLPVQTIFYKYYNASIFNKIRHKLGVSGIEKHIAARLQQKVAEWKPDVVWVFKGMELSPETLQWTKNQGAKLVNYNPDNPFIFSGSGSGNSNITKSIGLYDLHFTYDRNTADKITSEYHIPCKILPFGFELDDKLYDYCRKQEEVKKVCFLGNPDKIRAQFLKQLSKEIAIDIYGEGWAKFVGDDNITVFPAVYGDAYWKTLYRYRVQLNLMRPHNETSHNMRSFEVPGVGGIGLFPATPDHEEYFNTGKEIFTYKNIDECIQRGKELMAMPDEAAVAIRSAARYKSLQAGYTYRNRALQALQDVRQILL